MFHQTIHYMADYLKDKCNATTEELDELEKLVQLRVKFLQDQTVTRTVYSTPSVVLDDFLYHGDLGHASNMRLLKELGIRHIVSVIESELDTPIKENFHVMWINIYDELHVDIKKYFDQTNQFLYECKEKNEKILVHCQMGISRSSTIVLAYLMKYHHDSLSKAYEYLLQRRRIASPNLSFLLQLIRYENVLRANKDIDESKHNDDQTNPIEIMNRQQDPSMSDQTSSSDELMAE